MGRSLTAWFFIVILITAPSSVAALQQLDQEAMRDITGREGVAVDLSGQGDLEQLQWTDSDGAAGGAGQGVLRIGDGAASIRIDRNGSAMNLQNLRFNVDNTNGGRSFITLPHGPFDVQAPDITVANATTDGDQTTHFGSIKAVGIDFQQDNTISIGAESGGINISGDYDNPVKINRLTYTDPDGSSGNSGTFGLSNFRLEDTRYSIYSFDGLQLHADASGLVLAAPTDMNDVGINTDVTINNNTLFNATIGRSSSGIHLEGSQLVFDGRDDGVEVIPTVKIDDIDEVRVRDPDGVNGTSSYLNAETIQVGDIFGVTGVNAANLGSHTIDIDSSRGIVLQAPSRTEAITPLDVAIGSVTVDSDFDDMLAVDFSNIDYRGSSMEVQPGGANGDGLTVNAELELTLNEIRVIDPGYGGYVSLGEIGAGQGITVDDGSGNPASFTGATIDVDGSSGVTVGAPDGTFGVEVTDAHLGDNSTSLGSFEGNNFSVRGSTVRVQPH